MNKNEIHIRKPFKSYWQRIRLNALLCVVLTTGVCYCVKEPTYRWILGVFFFCVFLILVRSAKNLVTAVITNSFKIIVHYLEYNQPKYLECDLEAVQITTKNTSNRAGFDCKLILRVDKIQLQIKRENGWELQDLKLILKFIVANQKRELTKGEKFDLAMMEKQIAKLEK